MFSSLSTWYPAPGNEGEMLARGTAFVKERQTRGERYGLSMRLYSQIGSVITLARMFPDLGEIEAAREHNRADQSLHDAVAKASALSRAPYTTRLWEWIVPPGAPGEIKYLQTVYIHPAPGNSGAVRALLTEGVRGGQARQRRLSLAIDLYNADGQVFILSDAYASLSEVGERRAANMEDHAWGEWVTQVNRLSHKPPPHVLSAIVVAASQ